MITIAFTGGGTAGHIYPALAVAQELLKLDANHRILWIGSSSGMDRGIVEDAGIDFFGIPSGKLRRYFSLKNLSDIFRIIAGFFAARKILKRENVKALFSKGGFVSVPPCAAASSLKIPVFTHESDYSPGLATRINARFALRTGGRIFTSYNDTSRFFSEKYRPLITVSGNPVRGIFRNADAEKGRAFLGIKEDAPSAPARIMLVLGGSQGSTEINELVKAALPELTALYTVVHQTGPGNKWDLPVTERYMHFPFIADELPHIMAASELVMGRSGAGIWEWAVLGKPMVLIPLEGKNTRGDQTQNAGFFAASGAAYALKSNHADPAARVQALVCAVETIAHNSGKRASMAAASAKIGEYDGAGFLARFLYDFIVKKD